MGNCSNEDDRQMKYKELYNGIYSIEKDILDELEGKDFQKKTYKTFGLINKGLCEKYPYLLKDYFDYNETLNYKFNNKDFLNNNIKKKFIIINSSFSFTFPSNFIFIFQDFMDVIHNYVSEKDIKNRLISKFDTKIGGGCLIMKNPNDFDSKNPFRYIILYRKIKEKEGNEIDFFLYINDKKKREDTVDFIMEKGIWKFFEKIKYSYKEEYKIFDAGYIVRSCNVSRVESYLNNINNKPYQIEKKKKMPKYATNVVPRTVGLIIKI